MQRVSRRYGFARPKSSHGRQQRFLLNWLYKVVIKSGLARTLSIFGLAITRHGQDEFFLEAFATEGSDHFVAVHSGQTDIEKDDFGSKRAGRLQGSDSIKGSFHFVPQLGE